MSSNGSPIAVSVEPMKHSSAEPVAILAAPKRSMTMPPTSASGMLGRLNTALSSPICD